MDVARLRLRIASRPVEWSVELESGLETAFGVDSVQACKLRPLTEEDVRSAATANGLKADAFMTGLDRLRLLPLAGRPLTLRFLLESFAESGSLPDTQQQAHARGLLGLCRGPQATLRRRHRAAGSRCPLAPAGLDQLARLAVGASRGLALEEITVWRARTTVSIAAATNYPAGEAMPRSAVWLRNAPSGRRR